MDFSCSSSNDSFSSDYSGRSDLSQNSELPDRFIPARPAFNPFSLDRPDPATLDARPSDVSCVASQLSLPVKSSAGKRILSFKAPVQRRAPYHWLEVQRQICAPSLSSTEPSFAATRKPPYEPYGKLSAPGYADDFYLNLFDWGSKDQIAVALRGVDGEHAIHLRNVQTGAISMLTTDSRPKIAVNGVTWSPDAKTLAVGLATGVVEIWDAETGKITRTMSRQSPGIASLSWCGEGLSTGSLVSSIWHRDLRVKVSEVVKLTGHPAGLRIGASVLTDKVPPKWSDLHHASAVKALAWCPWRKSVLATGGGTLDKSIHLWNITTGTRTNSVNTGAVITSLIFSQHSKELLTTHGSHNSNLSMWSYPDLTKIYETGAQGGRILGTALGPDGASVAAASADELLRFWKIWDVPKRRKSRNAESSEQRLLAGIR